MSVLNNAERAWLRTLQKVLDDCPSKRLGFYTIGDARVTVFDTSKEAHFDNGMDFCNAVEAADAVFDTLKFPNLVHSTSG